MDTLKLSRAEDTDTKYCINSTVQYQCSITGEEDTALVWKVFDAAGKCVGEAQPYSTGCKIKNNAPQEIIASDFSIRYLISCGAKLISNISFTTRLHHEGYRVECSQYTDGGPAKTWNIAIAGHNYFALHTKYNYVLLFFRSS